MNKKLAVLTFFIGITVFNGYCQDSPPSIIASGSQGYCPGTSVNIATAVDITDPDVGDTTLDLIRIQISEGYNAGNDELTLSGIHPSITTDWSVALGVLTLNGPATFNEFEAAILDVLFQTSQTNFTEDKFFSINIGSANYLPSTDHYYFYVADLSITWTEAETAAASQSFYGLQGYLATISSIEESQLAGEQSPGAGWIGATDAEIENTWKWVTGPEAGTVFWIGQENGTPQNGEYNFWNTAEPNNFGGNEDYAHITDPSIGQPGSWNDLPVTGDLDISSPYHPKGYLVEFGGMPGDPSINLSASTSIITPRIIDANNAAFCENDAITLNISSNTDTILWYDSATSITPIHNGFTYNPVLVTTTTYWVVPVFAGCTVGERTQIIVTINTQPEVFNTSIRQCEDGDVNDGITTFNLNNVFSEIVNGSTTNFSISFYSDIALTNQIDSDYTNTSNPQTIYALVTDTNNNCTNTAEVILEVGTDALNNALLLICDDSSNDGLATFNLSEANTQVLLGLPQDIMLEFYLSIDDALLQNNQLTNDYINVIPESQIIYVRGEQNNNCYGIAQVELQVNSAPDVIEDSEIYYCLNEFPNTVSLTSGVIGNSNDFSYSWSTSEVSESIVINTVGTYVVTITDNNTNCSISRSINVLPSNIATIEEIEILDVSQNNTISIFVSGEGNYQYALDDINGPYQDANTFTNVTANVHTVYVRDVLNNCGIVNQDISVIGYPNYFTPNNDTKNDTWSIKGLLDSFNGVFVVNIYDRYGKLLYTLKDKEDSWDGTYNGVKMPTSDYWFTVFLGRGKNFKGHFTLKR
ncbi:T9SS type B sorting domain-containing protein [uncultured Lacinutrix sp.]|uniref:T9SS type B sorting domain-containing protein n=1 Tax=uncultured Lacinutrix sp. TaxID=574032 RepID=UPI00261FB461|nr:T9SS type B sorting domain-containing protein [uncultured Lacinutrix sp.]